MKIGYYRDDYPEERTINYKINKIIYSKLSKFNNYYYYINFIKRKLNNKDTVSSYYKYKPIIPNRVNLYHFFNHIPYNNKPFITTFETCLPRVKCLLQSYNKPIKLDRYKIQKRIKILSKKNCKCLIAISECSKKIQLELLNYCDRSIRDIIMKKIVVLHPPQEAYFTSYKEKLKYINSNEIRFIFIGRDFYRKGGYEFTKVFNKISSKYNIMLTLIGDIENVNDYTKKVTEEEVKEIREIIRNNNKISYYSELRNDKVIELIKSSDVGLLTTWADTYGYSLLEMQACGCPVISTNVRAIPEINNDIVGWVINLPLTVFNEADYFSVESRQKIREILLMEIEKIVLDIVKNRDIIYKKGNRALQRIIKEHNPVNYQLELEKIYDSYL